ncbi:hypothetical protein LIA77_05850 [Sarocladium implicatum]|nr:hypothetical protein LIA77_05850 [Sarocladium implicatum]
MHLKELVRVLIAAGLITAFAAPKIDQIGGPLAIRNAKVAGKVDLESLPREATEKRIVANDKGELIDPRDEDCDEDQDGSSLEERDAEGEDDDDGDKDISFESPEDEAAFRAEVAAIEQGWLDEAVEEACTADGTCPNDLHARGKRLERRAWTSKHSFQFLHVQRQFTTVACGVSCVDHWDDGVLRFDTCSSNPCKDTRMPLRDGFKYAASVCHKKFTACRNGKRKNLIIRRDPSKQHSCKQVRNIFGDKAKTGSYYGVLRDRSQNNKRVGHCVVNKSEGFRGKTCSTLSAAYWRSVVVCGWN